MAELDQMVSVRVSSQQLAEVQALTGVDQQAGAIRAAIQFLIDYSAFVSFALGKVETPFSVPGLQKILADLGIKLSQQMLRSYCRDGTINAEKLIGGNGWSIPWEEGIKYIKSRIPRPLVRKHL